MRIARLSLLALSLLALPASAFAGEPELIAVKFHADWCGSCKKMGPVFEDLQNKFDGQPVLFVVLDRTNVTSTHRSALLASALGVRSSFTANPGTGFILLIDAKTREVRGRLGTDQTLKQMSAEISAALGKS